VVLYSKKQQDVFDRATLPDTDTRQTQIIRQWKDGGILLHRFFKCDGHWLGYAETIGPRGGRNASHGFSVVEESGTLTLILNH
jgi:hypothetical protein